MYANPWTICVNPDTPTLNLGPIYANPHTPPLARCAAREKQLEEARRLASLQKRRELKAAGPVLGGAGGEGGGGGCDCKGWGGQGVRGLAGVQGRL
jgi:hypothetical protein